jgi:hypothetical protein
MIRTGWPMMNSFLVRWQGGHTARQRLSGSGRDCRQLRQARPLGRLGNRRRRRGGNSRLGNRIDLGRRDIQFLGGGNCGRNRGSNPRLGELD